MVSLVGNGLLRRRPRLIAATQARTLDRDAAWFWTVTLLLTVLVGLPVLLNYLHTPAGYTYTGFMAGGDDYYTYLEKMREGWQGDWFFTNRYTVEGHRPAFIFGFYLLLGHIARWLGLPLWAGYHLSRLVLFPLALGAVWAFFGTQVRQAWQRRWALLLTFGLSSFGALAAEKGPLVKLEMHLGEHLYLASFYPHYLIDGIALCWALVCFQRYLQAPRAPWLVLGALCLWVLALIHPFMVLPALAVPAVYTLIFRQKLFWRTFTWGAVLTAAVAPAMAYMAFALYGDPGLAAWRAQAIARPFPAVMQLLWFGVAGPLALYGAWRALRTWDRPAALAVVWVAVDLLLINARLIDNGLEFAIFMGAPVALLVVYGLEPLRERWRRPLPAALLKASLVLTMGFSCLMMQVTSLAVPFTADAQLQNRFYLSPGYLNALQYIGDRGGAAAVTLSSFTAANQLPAYTGGRVYMGHTVETVDFKAKYAAARSLYTGEMEPAAALQLLREQGVTYVLEDRYSGYDMHYMTQAPWPSGLSRYGFLQPVFTTPDATVYAVDL